MSDDAIAEALYCDDGGFTVESLCIHCFCVRTVSTGAHPMITLSVSMWLVFMGLLR